MEQQRDAPKLRDAGNLLYIAARGHMTCLSPFMRSRFGVEALGWNGVAALLVQALYLFAAPDPVMARFFGCWLVAIALRNLGSRWRYCRGWVEHSFYDGWPWLALWVPFINREVTAKNAIEPMLCLLGGAFLMPVSSSLGTFVLLGFFSFAVVRAFDSEINHRRVRRMHDAQIEMRQASRNFRGQTNDY